MFKSSEYLDSSTVDKERAPEETVLEYIKVFTNWSKDCHSWIKSNSASPEQLTRAGGRGVLEDIRKKYCVSKNRQFSRSAVGHYYIGGASKVHPVIDYIKQLDRGTVEIVTKCHKEKNLKSHKFILRKVGSAWKICGFAGNAGKGRWLEESM